MRLWLHPFVCAHGVKTDRRGTEKSERVVYISGCAVGSARESYVYVRRSGDGGTVQLSNHLVDEIPGGESSTLLVL